jgi:hypothetical protein
MTIAALWIAKGHVHCASKITAMCSNWDSSDSAVTLNGLDGLGLISDRPSDLWHPPSPLSKEKRGQSGRDEKPTTHFYLFQMSGMTGALPPCPLHAFVLGHSGHFIFTVILWVQLYLKCLVFYSCKRSMFSPLFRNSLTASLITRMLKGWSRMLKEVRGRLTAVFAV